MIRFNEKIEYKRFLLLDIIVFSPILMAIMVLINTNGTPDAIGILVFVGISVIAFVPWLFRRKAYQKLIIDDNYIILEKVFFVEYKKLKYDINQVNNINYKANEKSNISYSFVVFDTPMGPRSPEATKTYLSNP